MTAKEIEVMSSVLALDIGVSYFCQPGNRVLQKEIPKLSLSELTRVKKRLVGLKLLDEKDHPKDKRKNLTLPVKSLLNFQKYVKNQDKIMFVFPYEITRK
jgi:hypothetical protein